MRNMTNNTHIAGALYQHDLAIKVTGENSKKPGTEFISGNIEIVTDDAGVNIVPVHFTYVTAVTGKGKDNATFKVLYDIIDGKHGTVMTNGADNAATLRIDSAIGLNEFYSDRSGKEELVSVKRNEGGFVHVVGSIVFKSIPVKFVNRNGSIALTLRSKDQLLFLDFVFVCHF